MEIILVLLVVALLALGLLLYLQLRKTNAGPLDLVSLIQTNHQLMGDKLQQQERMLRETLQKQEHAATASIGRLNERLAVINSAQKNISDLAGQIGSLQNVLDNKQARGLFGEFQLENLVRSALPPDSYALQHTLSNGRRVDCLIRFPSPPGPPRLIQSFRLNRTALSQRRPQTRPENRWFALLRQTLFAILKRSQNGTLSPAKRLKAH